jgi:hypothetical protein
MKALDHFRHFFLRFRYPVSLPEDVAKALGVPISNFVTFEEFVDRLTSPKCRPTRLQKFMSREKAEQAFQGALRKEHFREKSLYSYYFNEKGWVEFILQFDDQSRLRRIYLQHKNIEHDQGLEISLSQAI